MRVDSVRMARSDGWTPSTRVHRHQERERRENERWHRRRNTARGRLTKNKQAQVLSDWGKPTFNTISARADFAARRPDVLGVLAMLLESAGRPDDARSVHEAVYAATSTPEARAAGALLLANFERRAGGADRVDAVYARALADGPSSESA